MNGSRGVDVTKLHLSKLLEFAPWCQRTTKCNGLLDPTRACHRYPHLRTLGVSTTTTLFLYASYGSRDISRSMVVFPTPVVPISREHLPMTTVKVGISH